MSYKYSNVRRRVNYNRRRNWSKCILKFENGVLKINGKEIATVENS